MGNEIIYLGSILLAYTLTVLAYRQGVSWLYCWLAVAAILSIPAAGMIVSVFGFAVNAGMALYVCTFLGTDILTEQHGKAAAKKAAVIISTAIGLFFIFSHLALLLQPDPASGETYELLVQLFETSARLVVAGIISFLVSQYLDIWIFEKIRRSTGGKWLWLRNNTSTILSQVLDNFLFFYIAFYGVFPNLFELAIGASVVRIFLAMLDTPFIYWAKRYHSTRSD